MQNAVGHLVRLQKLGCLLDFPVAPPPRIPGLTWPSLPSIAIKPANIFICPGCGDRFIVQPYAAVPAAEARLAEAEPVEAEPVDAEPVEAAEVVEVAEAVEAEAVSAEVVDAEPVAAEPVPAPAARPAEPARMDLAPSKQATPEEVEASRPEKPLELQDEAGDTLPDDQLYRVSLRQRVKGSAQKKQAAALIAKYQGISEKQALKLAEKALCTIARRVSKEEAEACKKEFREIGLTVRAVPVPAQRG